MPVVPLPDVASQHSRQLAWAGYLLGFALGGFFDGILLHQVLQWHHLLSSLEGGIFGDIRVQVLADGLFHVLMYILAAIGLLQLWRGRRDYAARDGDRFMLARALLGFGIWHVLDTLLSHWILRIHRIRPESDNPLFWDVLWLAVFGLAFLVAGLVLCRKKRGTPTPRVRSGGMAAILAFAVVMSAPIAALPPAGNSSSSVLVFFRPGKTPVEIFKAIDAVQGRILWANGAGDVWAVHVGRGPSDAFYRHGAYLVSNSSLLASCLAWMPLRG
jgi:uncharacterized membrane protein